MSWLHRSYTNLAFLFLVFEVCDVSVRGPEPGECSLWGDRNLVNAHCEGTGFWWMLIDKVYFSLYIQILPVNDVLTAIVWCVILNWKFPYLFFLHATVFIPNNIVYPTKCGKKHHFNIFFFVSQTIKQIFYSIVHIHALCVCHYFKGCMYIQFVDIVLGAILFLNLNVNHNFAYMYLYMAVIICMFIDLYLCLYMYSYLHTMFPRSFVLNIVYSLFHR